MPAGYLGGDRRAPPTVRRPAWCCCAWCPISPGRGLRQSRAFGAGHPTEPRRVPDPSPAARAAPHLRLPTVAFSRALARCDQVFVSDLDRPFPGSSVQASPDGSGPGRSAGPVPPPIRAEAVGVYEMVRGGFDRRAEVHNGGDRVHADRRGRDRGKPRIPAPITYVDPSVGKITLTEWVNEWYPALDLEPTSERFFRPAADGSNRSAASGQRCRSWWTSRPRTRDDRYRMADGRARPGISATSRPGRRPPHQRYRDRPVCGLWSRVAVASAARFVRPACPRAARE